MKTLTLASLLILTAACASHQAVAPATAPHLTKIAATDALTVIAGSAPIAVTLESTPAPTPEESSILRIQDRLNVFASPRYVADIQAAKVAGSDALQNACMDSTVAVGADLKAKPLITILKLDMSNVDASCGWCVLAAKRKLAEQIRTQAPLVTRLADARVRMFALARQVLIGCAPLGADIRLQALTPENAVADLLALLELVGVKP